MRARLNLLVYTSPEQLRMAMAEFIEFYNQRRYHEGIGNVTPADVYYGRREGILKRREEQKRQTLDERFQYNFSRKANRAPVNPRLKTAACQMGSVTLRGAEDAQKAPYSSQMTLHNQTITQTVTLPLKALAR